MITKCFAKNIIGFLLFLVFLSACKSEIQPNFDPYATQPSSAANDTNSTGAAKCLSTNPERLTEQVAYQGILPGKTTEEEVIDILGVPRDTFPSPDGLFLLEYDRFEVALDQGIVSEIVDYNTNISVEGLVEKYGCPDLILTSYSDENALITRFVFIKGGVFFSTFDTPVSQDSILYPIYFVPVESADTFINGYFMKYLSDIKTITWDEILIN